MKKKRKRKTRKKSGNLNQVKTERSLCRWCGDNEDSPYVCIKCLKLTFKNLKERIDELRHFYESEREGLD